MDWPVDCFDTIYFENSRNGLTRPKRVRGEGYKMINMGELYRYDRLWNPEMELVPLSTSEIEKYSLKNGDLLFARQSLVLEGTGKCSIIMSAPEITCFESHLIRVRLDKQIADPLFYYYYFSSPQGKANVQTLVMQVAAAGIRGSELAKLKIPVPPLLTQRKIAAILSAYDDLIENNLRRIKILEEMAQNLYREWFVNFRFPGHEQTRFVDSPLGRIPEGWVVATVDNTFEIHGGGTPSKKVDKYWDGGDINWYTPSDLTATKSMFMDESSQKITQLGLKKSSAKLFSPFSVMMTSRATLGVISINMTEACTNQGFITCIPNEKIPLYILYHWLKENVEIFNNHASGATFKEISKGVFKTLEIIVPPREVTTRFEDIIQPMGSQTFNLQRENSTLRQTRDLLLPKLISGEVDVSNIDINVLEEEAV